MMDKANIKIAEIRSRENLSRQKFADKLGFSKSYIADIETGRTTPSKRFLTAISREYGISNEFLDDRNLIIQSLDDSGIIYVFDFTYDDIEDAWKKLNSLFSKIDDKKLISIDASQVNSGYQLTKLIVNKSGSFEKISRDFYTMLSEEPHIIFIRNLSLSKIEAHVVKGLYNVIQDVVFDRDIKNSNLVLLDFPSYLEKNIEIFGKHSTLIWYQRMLD